MIHTLSGNSRPSELQMVNRAFALARDIFSICHGSPSCPITISKDDTIDIEIKTIDEKDTVLVTLVSMSKNRHHKIILTDSFLLSYAFMSHDEALQQLVLERKRWQAAQTFNVVMTAAA